MLLYDTHAHLDLLLQKLNYLPPDREFNLESGKILTSKEIDLEKHIVDEFLKEHEFIIHPTVSTGNFNLAYALLQGFEKVYFLIGSHPELVNESFDLQTYLEEQRDLIVFFEEDTLLAKKVVGLGECGLDYHYSQDINIWLKQKSLFEEQIRLALKLNLPLVIHCRQAFSDLFDILQEYPGLHGNFLVHCFTERPDTLKKILDLGGKVGLGGVTTYNSAKDLQESVKYCPLDSLVLETDLPFLPPNPHRGQTCMPEMIKKTAQQIANLKQLEVTELWENSRDNAIRFFRLNM